LISRRETVVNLKPVVEGIGPKLDRETGPKEHCMNSIGNYSGPLFNWAILVGSIGTSHADVITKPFEELDDNRVVVQFTTLVQEDVFVRAFGHVVLQEVA